MVLKKEGGLIFPISYSKTMLADTRNSKSASWRDIICAILEHGQQTLEQLYRQMEGKPKTTANPHWKEKIRQTVQNTRYFRRVAEGTYALAA